MKLIEKTVFEKEIFLVSLSDLHIGSPYVDWDKFSELVSFVKSKKNAFVVVPGDIFDTAVIDGATNTFTQTMSLNAAMTTFYDAIFPIKNRILGVVSGNHEERLEKRANFNPLRSLCEMKGLPYCGYSCVIRFRIGKYERKKLNIVSPRIEYQVYVHHTTGGGSTTGGKMNRIEKLMRIFPGADIYIGGHNHLLGSAALSVFYVSKSGNGKGTLKQKDVFLVDSGSYLKYDSSYPEMKEHPPLKTGFPIIRMSGIKREIEVSIK